MILSAKRKIEAAILISPFIFSFLCFPTFSFASDNVAAYPSAVVQLEPITVTAVRSDMTVERVAENVAVYSDEKIQLMPVHNLAEVLSNVPGVDISSGTQLGQAASVTIHGSNPRDVLVMVDDIPFNTQLSGQANPNRIPIENIGRVEVIKGGSSSTWGSSLGGVINVITKDVGDTAVPKGNITNSFGELATRRHSLDLEGKAGAVGYLFTDSYFTTDGAHFKSPVREDKSFGKVAVPLGDQAKLTSSFGYSMGHVQELDSVWSVINKTPYVSRYGKVRLDLGKPDFDLNMAYKYNDQKSALYEFDALSGDQLSASANRNVYHGLSLNGHAAVREDDMLTAGADFEWDTIKSDNYLPASKDIRIQAPYANYTWKVDHWDIVPGVRYDNNNRFGNQLSPSLGSIYHFDDAGKTEWRGKVSRVFNAPPLMWIYNEDPAYLIAPNPDLKAERALVYETGISTNIARLRVDVNFYRNEVTDGIATVYDSDLGAYQKQNIGKVRRQGAETQLTYKVSDALKMYVAGEYNRPVNRATRQVIRGNGVNLQNYRWGINYNQPELLGIDLYGHYDRWDSNADSTEAANDRKPIFDLKVTKEWTRVYKKIDLEVFLNVYNIANSKYWSDPAAPFVGRYWEGGATLKF